jgi:BirA family biotin operon repressor/biotin-[acetyl-CoA-carboxylase] ligase
VGTTLAPDRVAPLLKGRFGRPYLHREVCASTQELVRDLAEGAVAACEEQTAGRGRMGRTWACPRSAGVLFSLSLWPRTPAEDLAPLSLVIAEAVCEALDERAMVRWPNDVTVNGRKLAGVLIELRAGQMIAGIGVNANLTEQQLPANARVPATSLLLERGAEVDRAQVLADLLEALERRYDRFERDGFTGLERDELRGRTVTLVGAGQGFCAGTAADGSLVVEGVAYRSAEVERVEL